MDVLDEGVAAVLHGKDHGGLGRVALGVESDAAGGAGEVLGDGEGVAEFNKALPGILGALFDGLVVGLRELPNTKLASKPRMADFAMWATACETAYWPPGTVMAGYDENRADAVMTGLRNNPVTDAIMRLVQRQQEWSGSATALLHELSTLVGIDVTKVPSWPKAPRTLADQLRRYAPDLRKVGIDWHEHDDTVKRTMVHTITGRRDAGNADVQPTRGRL